MRAPREIVERFIEEHKEWILKKRCEWGMNKAVDSSKILPGSGEKRGKAKDQKINRRTCGILRQDNGSDVSENFHAESEDTLGELQQSGKFEFQ